MAELTEEAAEANKKLEWEKGENSVLKKKHASAIKVSRATIFIYFGKKSIVGIV